MPQPNLSTIKSSWYKAKEAYIKSKLQAHLGYLPSNEAIVSNAHRFIMADGIECYTWKDECFAAVMPPLWQESTNPHPPPLTTQHCDPK